MSAAENPPAFPVLHSIDGNWVREPLEQYRGMSLRDWFAGQALAGTLADASNQARIADIGKKVGLGIREAVAKTAYEYADAMLAERAKGGAA